MTLTAMILKMSEGLGRTCAIFFLTLLFSLPLGLLVALLRMSRNKIAGTITKVYISVLRGTPLMLQLIAVAYGPFYLFGYTLLVKEKLLAIIIAFSLNYAAYFAEIYRGGIESMPVGQYEAAAVLGYSKSQTFMRIILPQVVKRMLPSMAFTLAYMEMFSIGKQIANSQSSFMPFVIAGVFYYIMNSAVAFAMSRCEKALGYYR